MIKVTSVRETIKLRYSNFLWIESDRVTSTFPKEARQRGTMGKQTHTRVVFYIGIRCAKHESYSLDYT